MWADQTSIEMMMAYFPGLNDPSASYPARKLAYLVSWQDKNTQINGLNSD